MVPTNLLSDTAIDISLKFQRWDGGIRKQSMEFIIFRFFVEILLFQTVLIVRFQRLFKNILTMKRWNQNYHRMALILESICVSNQFIGQSFIHLPCINDRIRIRLLWLADSYRFTYMSRSKWALIKKNDKWIKKNNDEGKSYVRSNAPVDW